MGFLGCAAERDCAGNDHPGRHRKFDRFLQLHGLDLLRGSHAGAHRHEIYQKGRSETLQGRNGCCQDGAHVFSFCCCTQYREQPKQTIHGIVFCLFFPLRWVTRNDRSPLWFRSSSSSSRSTWWSGLSWTTQRLSTSTPPSSSWPVSFSTSHSFSTSWSCPEWDGSQRSYSFSWKWRPPPPPPKTRSE